jgi:beta-aspartyl-peptidase (threonine type)
VKITDKKSDEEKIVLCIHGGAGAIERNTMSIEKETAFRETLEISLIAGYNMLKKGGSALDAVEAAITVMEDSPLFNAGKGIVYICFHFISF